jgi:MFS family permease
MTQTISWMVQRETPANREMMSRRILTWFVIGGLIGGSVAGVLVVGLARIVVLASGNQVKVFALAALIVAVAYLGYTLRLWRMPKPQLRQQVPPSWRDVWSPRIASFFYSATLGFGFVTRISSLALFPLIVLTLGLGRWPLTIIALFGIVGLVRAAMALVGPLFGWASVDSRVIVDRLGSAGLHAQKLEALVLGVAGALLVAGVLT